jgi:hypothetical protein
MSSDKNLNECNGCLVINNDHNIVMPSPGKVNSYDINFEKPCFFVNNHYLTPLLKCYSVTLPNPVSLEEEDKLRVKIKVPKSVFGKKYGYDLQNLYNEINTLNLKVSMRLKSYDGCYNVSHESPEEGILGVDLSDHCGWLVFDIFYVIPQKICNLCEISYSLCFDPVKIKLLYGQCEDHDEENVKFPIETCLLLCKAPVNL